MLLWRKLGSPIREHYQLNLFCSLVANVSHRLGNRGRVRKSKQEVFEAFRSPTPKLSTLDLDSSCFQASWEPQ